MWFVLYTILTVLTRQRLSLAISLLCDWFTADKQRNESRWSCTVPPLFDTQTNCPTISLLCTISHFAFAISHKISQMTLKQWGKNIPYINVHEEKSITELPKSECSRFPWTLLTGRSLVFNFSEQSA